MEENRVTRVVRSSNGSIIEETSTVDENGERVITTRVLREPRPTKNDLQIASLEAQLAETDEAAIQLFESQMTLEEANAVQDEALIEIYEMMEGLANG